MTATADIMDAQSSEAQCGGFGFRDFGARASFEGRIRTIACLEDNALAKATLSTPGEGHVLVIDGQGSLRTALMGDMVAALAVQNGWSGVVINGAIRDSAIVATLDLGVKALGANPRPPAKTGAGQSDVEVTFGGIVYRPGAYLYADQDGIVVVPGKL